MSQEVQGMLVRIEATTAQLRREMENADRAVASTTRSIDSQLGRADRAFDRLNQNSSKSLGGIGKNVDLLAVSVRAATAAMAALGVGASFTRFIANTQAAEREQAQLGAVLRSTGEAAGYSADQLNMMGDKLAKSTTYSTGAITTAQTAMLAFTGVVGDEFARAMSSAADMSARTGMSMTQTAETIGRALDVPSQGMAALSRQGFRFSDDQKALMKQLEATGKTAEAQGIILDALEESYAGAAAAARNTLGGALEALKNSFDGLLTGSNDALSGVTSAVNALNSALSGDAARKAVSALGDALIVVSTIMAGRLVSAGYASAASFLAAQVQAIRYQAALAAMAGVSNSAAIGMTAASIAARAASGAMALIGGPVGAAVIAASAITYFATSASKAEREADALDARIQKLEGSFGSLNAAQAAAAILDYQEKLESAELAVAAAENSVISLANNIRSINDEKAVERWEKELVVAKGSVADANDVVSGLKSKIAELTAIIDQNTASQNANNAAVAGVGAAAEKYIDSINKRTAAIQDGNDPIKQANRHIKEHGQYTEDESAAILKAAQANKDAADAQKKANATTKSAGAAVKSYTKEIDDLIAKYNPAQKAQADYEKAIKMADAAFKKGDITTEQYQNTVQGLYKDLNKPMWDKHNKAAKEAAEAVKKIDDQLNAVRDRFDPLRAATRKLTEEKELFKLALDRGAISIDEYRLILAQLDAEYTQAARSTSDWAKWTDSALERVDGAFADAWRNIGDGFQGFRSGLTNAFKQMLAELAHMAITRPIIMQIGAAIGIGGGGAVSGIGGMLSSAAGGSGGISWGQLASYGQSAYSALTGWGPAAMAGYQSGGLWGGAQAVGSYYGSMLGNAASTVGGWLGMGGGAAASGTGYQLGGSLVSGGVGNASYAAGGGAMAGNAVAAAPWLSGIGGAFMGYQNSGLKGAAAGGLGGFGGAKLGATAGANFGPVGAAVGAIAGGILGALGGSKLFGGSWQTKAAGLALDVNEGNLRGWDYEYKKKKGGLFSSNKKKTSYSAMDAERLGLFTDAFDATKDSVSDLYKKLGFDVSDSVLSGLNIGLQNINTMGLSEENAQEAVAKWFADAAETITSHIDRSVVADLGLDFSGLQEFVSNLLGVNEVLRYLNVDIYDASVAGGRLAESLTAAAGGFDVLAANTATYYDQFFTETEKAEDVIDAVTRAFADAGVELTSSRESYRAMVEDIDLTTEAGQKMFATMMSLAGAASQYFSIVEQQAAQAIAAANQQAAQATSTAMTAAGAAYNTLQRSVQAERNRLTQEFQKSAQQEQARASQIASQQSASAAAYASQLQNLAGASQALVTALAGINKAMSSALDRLRDTSSNVVAFRRDQSVDLLRSALVQAQAGASLSTIDGIEAALDTASMLDSDTYRSMEDFKREQGRTSNLISELQTLNGKQLTIEERLLEQLKLRAESAKSSASQISAGVSGVSYQLQAKYDADMAALDEELAAAALQMDAMNGIDNTILTVGMAIDQMSAAVVAAINAQQREISIVTGSPQPAPEASSPAATIDRLYKSIVGYGADAQGIKFWSEQLASGGTYADLISALGSAAKGAAVPAFAAGGSHSGGLRLVGENGPELEVTGPSRIHSASQTAALLGGGGGDTAAAVHELRQSVESQADALRSIAKHTQQTAKRVEFIERWDYDGMPKERSAT